MLGHVAVAVAAGALRICRLCGMHGTGGHFQRKLRHGGVNHYEALLGELDWVLEALAPP
jgi:hypothetical protein